jgi:hypothetical protein
MNTNGMGIFNGAPNYALDVTGSIRASTDVLIGGNSVNIQLNNCAKLNGNNIFTNNNTFSDGITANSISLYNNTSYSDLNQRLLGDEQNIGSVTNTANNNQINLGGLQTTVNNLLPFTIKLCGYWAADTTKPNGGETTNGALCSAVYGNNWLSENIPGVQFILNSSIIDIQGVIIAISDIDGYVCRAHSDQLSSPFIFVINSQGGGHTPESSNTSFYWLVI